jgi:hypothetical protein
MPQDLSQCECEETPIQDPPGGDNKVAPQVEGVCFNLPAPPGGQMGQMGQMGGGQMNVGMMDPVTHNGGNQMGGQMDGPQMDFAVPPHPGPTTPGGQMGQSTQGTPTGPATPTTPGPQGPQTPAPAPPQGAGFCACVPDAGGVPTINQYQETIDSNGCRREKYVATFTYTCTKVMSEPFDPFPDWQPPPAGPGGVATGRQGETSADTTTCGDNNLGGCSGTCVTKKWFYDHVYCPEPPDPPGNTNTSLGGDFIEGNGSEIDGGGSTGGDPGGGAGGGTTVSPGSPSVNYGNNFPTYGESNFSNDPLGVIGSNVGNANLPPQAQAGFNTPAANTSLYPTEDELFDTESNLLVSDNQALLSFATNQAANPIFSQEGLFKQQINVAVGDILRGDIPYSGVAISNLLFNKQSIPESITESVTRKIEEAQQFNVTSRNAKNLLLNAIRRATVLGTLDGYKEQVLDEIIQAGKSFFPRGLPKLPEGVVDTGSRLRYSIVRNSDAAPILPGVYSDGDRQREIQRWRVVPTDVDLTVSVKTREGKLTGVRVNNDDGIMVRGSTLARPTTDLSAVYQLNEFVKVRREDSTVQTVGLVSNRDKAFVIPPQQEAMIQEYEPELIVSSTTYGGSGSVEVSGEGSAIPSVMLFSSTRETIKTLPAGDPDFTTTLVDYELAWDSITNGSDYTNFNATVSSWSGPRMSIYIDYRDPIWNYLLEKNTVRLRTTDFTRSLDGKVFPRKIYTDFAIYPTDLVKYSPYQGRSELETFEDGRPSVRTMRIVNSPLQSVAQENYVQSEKSPDGKAPSLEEDNYAFGFAARPSIVGEAASLHGTQANFTTVKSPLGKVFSRITDIDNNYNIQDGARGVRIPQPDVLFNMTAAEVSEFFEFVPSPVISNLFAGSYNGIKITPVETSDAEKTFLTKERQTGTELTNKVQNTALNDGRYFPAEFRGRLYK